MTADQANRVCENCGQKGAAHVPVMIDRARERAFGWAAWLCPNTVLTHDEQPVLEGVR
jgi:hypothetical protein